MPKAAAATELAQEVMQDRARGDGQASASQTGSKHNASKFTGMDALDMCWSRGSVAGDRHWGHVAEEPSVAVGESGLGLGGCWAGRRAQKGPSDASADKVLVSPRLSVARPALQGTVNVLLSQLNLFGKTHPSSGARR